MPPTSQLLAFLAVAVVLILNVLIAVVRGWRERVDGITTVATRGLVAT